LNLTSEALSVAEYSFTEMETSPNDSDAIERAGMCFSSRASTSVLARHGRLPETGQFAMRPRFCGRMMAKANYRESALCCSATAA